ncbi:MAG: hypothetical protein UY07_C0021G0018 [Parcubacteria group bacterium GW2011_GWA1_47_8]|nr:MAG: hypothetical protein UY07_C0021G0018 [Parcubacteria group bacterium GW2011_GWA1_47_8]
MGRLVGESVHLMFQRMRVPHRIIDNETSEEEKNLLFEDADIIVSGMGVPRAITPAMIKEGVILIDAGTSEQVSPFKNLFHIIQKFWLRLSKKFSRYPSTSQIFKFVSLKIFGFSEKEFLKGDTGNKFVGDIDPACGDKAAYMTPVPGGVGPITIVSLLRNLL